MHGAKTIRQRLSGRSGYISGEGAQVKLIALMRWEWQAGDQVSGKVLVKLAVGKESQEWIMTVPPPPGKGTRGLSRTGLIRETWNVGWIFIYLKLKKYRLWVDNASDGKRPDKLGGQLAVLHLEGQVTGGEPDLLADLVGRGRCAVLVGSSA